MKSTSVDLGGVQVRASARGETVTVISTSVGDFVKPGQEIHFTEEVKMVTIQRNEGQASREVPLSQFLELIKGSPEVNLTITGQVDQKALTARRVTFIQA